MENKEMKKPIPVALDDDALDPVSGGSNTLRKSYCPDCNRFFDITMARCPWCGWTANRFAVPMATE